MKNSIGFLLSLFIIPFISNAQTKTISKEVSYITKDSITLAQLLKHHKLKTKNTL